MRLIKMFGLSAMAAVAAMVFISATSASASTQLCTVHTGLTCGAGNAATTVHQVLASGTVGELLALISVLCLGFLAVATPLGLGSTQFIDSLTQSFTGCGTGSAHSDCTVSIPAGQQPIFYLTKSGLNEGTLIGALGQTRVRCPLLFGLDCLYDVAGMEFSAGGGHLTATEVPTTELSDKGLCPGEGLLDALLETLEDVYVLQ